MNTEAITKEIAIIAPLISFMAFHDALVNAEEAPLNSFEKDKYFEGCMPIEVMAKRGIKTNNSTCLNAMSW